MALELKGKTTYKADKDIKAGEEVIIEAPFEADQEAVEKVIGARVERARKERADEIKKLNDELAAAKAGGSDTDKLQKELNELKAKQAASDSEAKLMRGLKKAGALDLEDEFLPKVSAEDDEEAVEQKVKEAVKRREAFLKAHGLTGSTRKATGRTGGPPSEDVEPEDKEHASLLAEAKKDVRKLGLARRLENISDKSEQVKIMKLWKSQGLFEPKK